jgi:hypothetical protein
LGTIQGITRIKIKALTALLAMVRADRPDFLCLQIRNIDADRR